MAAWSPPPVGFAKLNVDGAVARSGRTGAVGVICRDSGGGFLGASAVVFEGISDPQVLEALACAEGLSLAEDLHEQQLLLATDCLNVVKQVREGLVSGKDGMIIKEIRSRMRNLELATICHERREANSEAHRLARSATSMDLGRHVWFTPPADMGIHVNIINAG